MDTILDDTENKIEFFIGDKIPPHVTARKFRPGSWSQQIRNSRNTKLNLFIIQLDTLLKYRDWEYIRTNRVYKRYEYTEEELNKKGWVIEYP